MNLYYKIVDMIHDITVLCKIYMYDQQDALAEVLTAMIYSLKM